MSPADEQKVREFVAMSLLEAIGQGPLDTGADIKQRIRMTVGEAYKEFVIAEQKRHKDESNAARRTSVLQLIEATALLSTSLLVFAVGAFAADGRARAELYDQLAKDQKQRVNKAMLAVRRIEKNGQQIADLMTTVEKQEVKDA